MEEYEKKEMSEATAVEIMAKVYTAIVNGGTVKSNTKYFTKPFPVDFAYPEEDLMGGYSGHLNFTDLRIKFLAYGTYSIVLGVDGIEANYYLLNTVTVKLKEPTQEEYAMSNLEIGLTILVSFLAMLVNSSHHKISWSCLSILITFGTVGFIYYNNKGQVWSYIMMVVFSVMGFMELKIMCCEGRGGKKTHRGMVSPLFGWLLLSLHSFSTRGRRSSSSTPSSNCTTGPQSTGRSTLGRVRATIHMNS